MTGNCLKCGVFRSSLHKDHIVPRWKGRSDLPENWQFICANCHEDKTHEEHRSNEYRELTAARTRSYKWTREQRDAQSARQLGKKRGPHKKRWHLTEEQKQKHRDSWTLEKRNAARQLRLGRPLSEQHRAAILAGWARRKSALVG